MAWWLRITNLSDGSSLVVPERSRYANRRDAESAASPFLKAPDKWSVEFLNKRPDYFKALREALEKGE